MRHEEQCQFGDRDRQDPGAHVGDGFGGGNLFVVESSQQDSENVPVKKKLAEGGRQGIHFSVTLPKFIDFNIGSSPFKEFSGPLRRRCRRRRRTG